MAVTGRMHALIRNGVAEALGAMLAALAGEGSARSAWTEGGVGFGRREVAASERHAAGLVLVADARLDDREQARGRVRGQRPGSPWEPRRTGSRWSASGLR